MSLRDASRCIAMAGTCPGERFESGNKDGVPRGHAFSKCFLFAIEPGNVEEKIHEKERRRFVSRCLDDGAMIHATLVQKQRSLIDEKRGRANSSGARAVTERRAVDRINSIN